MPMLALLCCSFLAPGPSDAQLAALTQQAEANAVTAQRLFSASHRYLDGWLAYRDKETGLIPQRLDSPLWTPENSAADHYAFMVITSYFTDPARLSGDMRDILDAEMRLSTRVRSLPDTVSLTTDSFAYPDVDINRLIFGAAEYCKDGILPITEVMGRTPWFDRMRQMALDICEEAPVDTAFGRIPSNGAEVNGEMLQALCRLYSATSDPAYLDYAERIADAYLLDAMPRNDGLPCHLWDFTAGRPINAALNLHDHGSEIIGGLSEAYVAASVHRPETAKRWEAPLRRMLDTILERSRNKRGILSMDPTGEGNVPDTWGYVYNAYYTAYMMFGDERYRQAVLDALNAITSYTEWNGADSYADCEESALVLLNREPNKATFRWLEGMVDRHLAMQRPDGIIEAWYGDGNSARTWLMYAMQKTGGTRVSPWRPDVRLGAAPGQGCLVLYAEAEEPWDGRLCFDHPRHRDNIGLTINYPRLNEWPEWWSVDSDAVYAVTVDGTTRYVQGYRLIEGLPVTLFPRRPWVATVRLASTFPLGLSSVSITGPGLVNLATGDRAELTIANSGKRTAHVSLKATAGLLSGESLVIPAGETRAVAWTAGDLPLTDKEDPTWGPSADVTVSAQADGEFAASGATLRVLRCDHLLDLRILAGGGLYEGRTYAWLGNSELNVALDPHGQAKVALRLLWGSKGDERHALIKVGDRQEHVAVGGYQGWRWVRLGLDLPGGTDKVNVQVLRDGNGPQAFLAEVALVQPQG